MVISNPSWVRRVKGTPAFVYTDSAGEMKRFPPLRTRGSVPRALTFSDYEEWPRNKPDETDNKSCQINDQIEDHDISSPIDYSLGFSFLIRSNTSKLEIEDPPEAYESFEFDNSRSLSLNEAPSMSTPTEHYSNLLKQNVPHSNVPLPQFANSPLSSGSDGPSVLSSPLVHKGPTAYLPLDELVDIYTKKMEAARMANAIKDGTNSIPANKNDKEFSEDDVDEIVPAMNMEVEEVSNEEEQASNIQDSSSDNGDDGSIIGNSQVATLANTSNDFPEHLIDASGRIQLMVFDIQMLLEKLDEIYDGTSTPEKSLCISIEQLESLVASCRKTNDNCETHQNKLGL